MAIGLLLLLFVFVAVVVAVVVTVAVILMIVRQKDDKTLGPGSDGQPPATR